MRHGIYVIKTYILRNEFKKPINLWKPEICLCRMCKTCIVQVGFICSNIHVKLILVKNNFFYLLWHYTLKKAEYFHITIIITINLLVYLNRSADIWEFFKQSEEIVEGRFCFCVVVKYFLCFSFCLSCILFLYGYY